MLPPSPAERTLMNCDARARMKADASDASRSESAPGRERPDTSTVRPTRSPSRGITPASRIGTLTATSRSRASDSSVRTQRPVARPFRTDVALRCHHRRHRALAVRQTVLAWSVARPPRRCRRGCRLHPPSYAGVRLAAPAPGPRCAQCPIGWTHRRLRQLPDGDSSLSARCGSSAFTTRRRLPLQFDFVRGHETQRCR
jgi:hypothetical protein